MSNYLVVANQTLGGEHLIEEVRKRVAAGPCRFHVVVPATPGREGLTWNEGEAAAVADRRLRSALESFRAVGAQVDGEVGDANPLLAIEDALRDIEVDEIILSTLPPGASKWLGLDLPSRVRAKYSVQVTHVVGQPEGSPTR